ncbi:hypothetical protein OJ997_31730 [Solirubrobacter phytolaccae]|uniref:Uncharacterized protein n=1 Tax=Solirubrobacter phytolaccae TaxID=1404360 RepID=A0A9X3NNX2_9ACTN|nr:hypothetical protein [Solirubrobacter phytolaccae]MDA0184917.1 hypothetical protein [Solirubrobacter phytolaccae]
MLIALVYGAIEHGAVGISVVCALFLALVVAELWRESARLTASLDATRHEIDNLSRTHEIDRMQIESASAKVEEFAALQCANDELAEEILNLNQRLADPQLTLVQTVDGVARQRKLLQITLRHRARRNAGEPIQWAVVSIHHSNEGIVEVRALSGGTDPGILSGELVALVRNDDSKAIVFGEVTSVDASNVHASAFPPSLLASLVAEPLSLGRSTSPDGLLLRLGGLDWGPFTSLSDEQLRTVDDALAAVEVSVSAALTATSPNEDHNA